MTSCGDVGCGTEARTNHGRSVAFLIFSKKRMLCKWASGLPKPFLEKSKLRCGSYWAREVVERRPQGKCSLCKI